MKRKGHQHGMVRSYRILPSSLNLRPDTRFVTRFNSPPTVGLFIKVPSKPTNHSKFTGKCGTLRCTGCHLHPACKSKDKAKGTQKHKYWRLMDRPDSKKIGLSATGMLDLLSNGYKEDEVEDESSNQVDYHVNDSCTLDDGDWVNIDDGICISEMKFQFQMDQVEEQKDEDEDWCLVRSRSREISEPWSHNFK